MYIIKLLLLLTILLIGCGSEKIMVNPVETKLSENPDSRVLTGEITIEIGGTPVPQEGMKALTIDELELEIIVKDTNNNSIFNKREKNLTSVNASFTEGSYSITVNAYKDGASVANKTESNVGVKRGEKTVVSIVLNIPADQPEPLVVENPAENGEIVTNILLNNPPEISINSEKIDISKTDNGDLIDTYNINFVTDTISITDVEDNKSCSDLIDLSKTQVRLFLSNLTTPVYTLLTTSHAFFPNSGNNFSWSVNKLVGSDLINKCFFTIRIPKETIEQNDNFIRFGKYIIPDVEITIFAKDSNENSNYKVINIFNISNVFQAEIEIK